MVQSADVAYLLKFRLVEGSLARDEKISSRIICLCFSYRQNMPRHTERAASCRVPTFSTKNGDTDSVEI